MSELQVRLLGVPTISGSRAAGGTLGAKSLALLTFLLLEPGPHSRERLATLLWGEHPDEAARASLRQALMQLRGVAGDALQVTRAAVELAGPLKCDAVDFLRAADQDPAVACRYEVPRFLDGFVIRHAPAFDEWAADTGQRLLGKWVAAHAALARNAMARWDWREAVTHAAAWHEADPISEDAVRLLIEGLFLAGDRAAALARYASYRSRLAAETGAEPGRALLQLMRRIEADASHSQTPRLVTEERFQRLPPLESAVIGRDAELDALGRAWNAARRAAGRVALVEGEAGVGKSRLVEELARRVVAQGGLVLRGRCHEAETVLPYGLMADVLGSALDAPGLAGTDTQWLAELSRLVPELRHRFPAVPELTGTNTSTDAWRLSEAVAQVLLAVSAEQPILVAIDDLHWADAESCQLIHAVVRRLEEAPVFWCATLTLGELTRDAPAARLSRALRARARAISLMLTPLGEDAVWQMIREMGHLRLPTGGRRLAGRVHEVTGGNPFYVVELLRTLFTQGWLVVDAASGEWLAAPDTGQFADIAMAPTVHDAIAERIESLPPDLYDLLITIALSGGGCRPDLLSYVHGISRLRAATMADALVERYLVTEEEGVYRAAHPVIARVVRHGLTTSRRREVHRTIALAYELLTPMQSGCGPGEIARHAELAGERQMAYRHAFAAAEAAIQRYAHEEALSWLDLAAGAAAPGAESDAVNRLTADVLGRAGWGELPVPVRRPTPAPGELERADLDLRVTSDR
jgi:DNA-binding SARP family transcriptional activator